MKSDGEHLNEFIDQLVLSGHSERTIDGYLRYLRRYDREVGMHSVERKRVAHWLCNPGWSQATRKSARTAIRAWYRWAAAEHLVPVDPTASLPRIKVPRTLPRPAPDDVWLHAWDRERGWQERMLLLLACHAGMRRSEMARMRRDWIVGDCIRVEGKGGRVRVVPMSPALQQEAGHWPVGLTYLCPGRWGGHVEPSYVGKRLSRMLGPGWSGHTLRHRAATLAYDATGDLGAVQEFLGHASPETTRIYTKVSAQHLRGAVEAGASLSPARPQVAEAA